MLRAKAESGNTRHCLRLERDSSSIGTLRLRNTSHKSTRLQLKDKCAESASLTVIRVGEEGKAAVFPITLHGVSGDGDNRNRAIQVLSVGSVNGSVGLETIHFRHPHVN